MSRSPMLHMVRLLCVCAALVVQVIRGCPNGWETFDGSCYFVSDLLEDWPTASTTCGLYHAHLAEIEDTNEENFLKQIVSKYHDGHSHDYDYWLGATDVFVEGDWRWMNSDQRLTYTDWYPDEPNDSNRLGEDCMVVHISQHQYHWDDRRCTEKHNFICEIGGGSGAIVIG
ncbi:perlucin-like protein [Mizuhopecten yessoensis]|uniref:Perlucin-like protein n=1 Tax=Mizuhopecten yessoensis TaxID=6573 RepID=A0A210PJI2_MIZYE|nr:perlucin-like protein [Mizuhopecten yessoensis]OWF36635.1 Perlucin-like protein [Mizuhopecten yessoensis]